MSKILLEFQQKDFKAWANDPDLATKYITTRSKYPAPYNSWDFWMSKKNNKTPDDLRKYMDAFKSKTQVKKDIKKEGVDVLYDDGRWECLHIKTYAAAAEYGSGTCWCITGRYPGQEERGQYFFNDYLEREYTGYYFVIDRQGTNANGQGGKWCVCPSKREKGKWTIWGPQDEILDSIPGIPAGIKVPGVKSLGPYTVEDGVLTAIKANTQGVYDIPPEVKAIKQFLFMDNQFTVREINFYENSQLQEIGRGAFLGAAIETMELPKSCTKLGAGAFLNCDKLRKINLGGVKEIPANCFQYCDELELVHADEIIAVQDNAFLEILKPEELIIDTHVPLTDEVKEKLRSMGIVQFAVDTELQEA